MESQIKLMINSTKTMRKNILLVFFLFVSFNHYFFFINFFQLKKINLNDFKINR